MKKNKQSEIIREIASLHCKIDKNWGHKHLYTDFQVLVDALEKSRILSKEEVDAIDGLIETLLYEAHHYALRWAIRCLDCAHILIRFIPEGYMNREERMKEMSTLLNQFISGHITDVVQTDYFKEYSTDAEDNNVEMLWKIASICFLASSCSLYVVDGVIAQESVMREGFRLSDRYLELSNDYSRLPDWFSTQSPCQTYDFLDKAAEQSSGRYYDSVVKYYEEMLNKQFSLLRKWLDADVEGFVRFWKADRIEELLELVEDDVFYDVLRKLSRLKDNPDVAKILVFYSEDDETAVRDFASRLLEDYN